MNALRGRADAAQIERARREVLVGAIQELAVMDGQANAMASGEFYAGNPRYTEVYLEQVLQISAKQREMTSTIIQVDR